ncbi:MAG: carboxypeptidase regulatory-like domain-containing protein [Candidatus Woesearchaeota archaeon]
MRSIFFKKELNMTFLVFFLLLLSAIFSHALEGCCINTNSVYFCSENLVSKENCCGSDQQCIETKFIEGKNCAEVGYCFYGVGEGCCRDSCVAAQSFGRTSPLLCSKEEFFSLSSCPFFSECTKGCAFCSGITNSIGYYTLLKAKEMCGQRGKQLSYFNTTVTEAECSNLVQLTTEFFSLSGRIVDTQNNPLENTKILIAGLVTTTDGDGNFFLQNIPKGEYTITASKDGYFENISKITVFSDITNYLITLYPVPKADLLVRVKYPEGTLVNDVSVSLFYNTLLETKTTNESGEVIFRDIDINQSNSIPKSYKIKAYTGDVYAETVTTLQAPIKIVELILQKTYEEKIANISGYVTGISDEGREINISGANISIGGKSFITTTTGYYKIQNVRAGIYTARIEPPPPYIVTEQIITVVEGENKIDFNVTRSGLANIANLKIFIVDNQNNPVEGAAISIRQIVSALPEFQGITSSAGEISATLQRATYEITILKQGFSPIITKITLDNDKELTFVMQPSSLIGNFKLNGYIINSTSQKGMPQATVYLETTSLGLQLSRWTLTDDNGYYEFNLIPPDTYIVRTTKVGYSESSAVISIAGDTEKNLTLGTLECFGEILKPEIKEIKLNKSSVIIKFKPSCEASGFYIYRCEGDVCVPRPITNILPNTQNEYYDTSIKPNTLYWYEVHSIHERPYVQEQISDKKFIFTGSSICFVSKGEFCFQNNRSICNENNTVLTIENQKEDHLCMYVNKTKTQYVPKQNCSVECNKPLGMFSLVGQLPIHFVTGYKYAPCSSTEFESYPALQSCYLDYETTVVDRYFSCENVRSCYDYRSKSACEQNRCVKNMNCKWRSFSEDLSLGVCAPVEKEYQNCSRCDVADKFNNLFGACNKELCSLYSSEESYVGCYFVNNKCQEKTIISCEHYGSNSEECIGKNNISVVVDVGGTNKILNRSEDILKFGLCRYNSSVEVISKDVCFKDADYNEKRDNNPTDMTPPETIVVHNTSVRAIDFNFIVYDDGNKTKPATNVETYYSIGKSFVYPNRLAENNRISALDVPEGYWNVYFFSKDRASNLEIVKYFPILIDKTPPPINFSYEYSQGILITTISSPEAIRCTAKLVKEGTGQNIQPENNLENSLGYSFIKQYSVEDGVYFYNYECIDWVGNEVRNNNIIVIDTEGFFYNMQPNGTITQSGNIQLSVDTKAAATCRYLDADTNGDELFDYEDLSSVSYDAMKDFDITGGTHHVTSVNINSNSIAKKYFLRCVITASGNITKSNISSIRFTIDKLPPNTELFEAWDVTNPPIFNQTLWRRQASLRAKCLDPQSPPTLPTQDYTPREFGCDQLFYCLSLESECEPQGVFDTTQSNNLTEIAGNVTAATEVSIYLNSTRNLCYYSKDKGNNKENKKCILIPIDNSPPKIKIVSTSATSDGRVKQPLLNVSGLVKNVAYYSESVQDIDTYFKEFDLYATANSEKAAEVKFDWRGINYYDYVMLDFVNSRITYGKAGGATTITSPVPLLPNKPVTVNIKVDKNNKNYAVIYLDDVYVGTFERIANEGRIILSNNSFSDILITDAYVTSPLEEENVAVIINGEDTGQRIPIGPDGTFKGQVDISKILSFITQQGAIEFQVKDKAGNLGTEAIWIKIDNIGPVMPPFIDPPINNNKNSFGENYMSLDYPIYYDSSEKIYYMGGKILNNTLAAYLSGQTAENNVYLELWADGQKISEYNESINYSILGNYTTFKTTSTSPEGSYNIRAPLAVKEIIEKNIQNRADWYNKTIYIGFSGHHRTKYGYYGQFYKVKEIKELEGTETLIVLEEPLEKEVKYNEQFSVSNFKIPNNRFEFLLPLPQVDYASTLLQIKQYDDLGNPGMPTDILNMVIDAVPPKLIFVDPYSDEPLNPPYDNRSIGIIPNSTKQNGRIVLNSLPNITIEIEEEGTGLRENSFNFTINGQKKNINFNITSSIGRTKTYSLVYVPDRKFDNGLYDLYFSASDKANNKLEITNWKIVIDNNTPQKPSFFVTNGVNISLAPDGYTFVSDVPELKVSYPDTTLVDIISARLFKNQNPLSFVNVKCERELAVSNIFNCFIIGNASQIPPNFNPEGDYHIEFIAVKKYSDGTVSNPSINIFYFSLDKTPPNITSFSIDQHYINTKTPITFKARVNNEDSHYLKINISINGKVIKTNSTQVRDNTLIGSVSAEDLLQANLVDGITYPVNLIATDYAGNTNNLAYDNITIDDSPPYFSPADIEISAQPIYFYYVSDVTNKIYIVREDMINISGRVPDDTVMMSFYRLTGTEQNYTTKIYLCSQSATTNCIKDNGEFFSQSRSLVIGEQGKVITNIIIISATDRAGNTFEAAKFIYRDIEKPTVIVCTQTECSEEIKEVSPPITNPQDIIKTCATKQDCYDILISGACEDKTTRTIDPQCYKNYIIEIKKDFLYPLCYKIPLYTDSCMKELAIVTGASGLCEKISNSQLQKECYNNFVT